MANAYILSSFQGLKKTISTFYSENSKAVTDGDLDLMPVLRECDKMECLLEGDYNHVIAMEKEDAAIAHKKLEAIMDDFTNDTNTLGPTEAMKEYGLGIRQRRSAVVKWAVAKGRVEAAREVLETLIAEEQNARAALDSVK